MASNNNTGVSSSYVQGQQVKTAYERFNKKSSGTSKGDPEGGTELFAVEDPPSVPGDTKRQIKTSEKAALQHTFKGSANNKNRGPELFPEEKATSTALIATEASRSNHTKQGSGKKQKRDKNDGLSIAPAVHFSNQEPLHSSSWGLQQFSQQPHYLHTEGPSAYRVDRDRTEIAPAGWDGVSVQSIPGATSSVDAVNDASVTTGMDSHAAVASMGPNNPPTDEYSNTSVTQVPRSNGKAGESKRGSKRRKWCAIGAAVLIITSVAVGLGVGLSYNSKSETNKEADSPSSPATPEIPTAEPTLAPSPLPTMTFRPTIPGSQWNQLGQDLYGNKTFDEYGQWLSVSGDGSTLAIASAQTDDRQAYIQMFRLQEGGLADGSQQWIQVGDTLFQDTGTAAELSFDGSRIVIGTRQASSRQELGMVEVFELDNTTRFWIRLGTLLNGTTASFGFAVSISGDGSTIAIVDAELSYDIDTDSETLGVTGGVVLYRWTTDQQEAWMPLGETILGEAEGDNIASVALDFNGTVVAIGAPDNDGSTGVGAFNRGHVRVFELLSDSIWVQRGADLEPNPLYGEDFGFAVDLNHDGSVLAVGDRFFERSNAARSGAVSVFRFDGMNWGLQGDVIEGAGNDQFGWSLELSGDGSIVVVGAPRLAFQTDFGYARAFHLVRGSWVRLGQQLEGEGEAGTDFGWHVGMSADGRIIAVADTSNDEAGEMSGSVRIFELF